jgi:transposase
MPKPTQHSEEIITLVVALDIGKAEVICCVRMPNPDRPGNGRRR